MVNGFCALFSSSAMWNYICTKSAISPMGKMLRCCSVSHLLPVGGCANTQNDLFCHWCSGIYLILCMAAFKCIFTPLQKGNVHRKMCTHLVCALVILKTVMERIISKIKLCISVSARFFALLIAYTFDWCSNHNQNVVFTCKFISYFVSFWKYHILHKLRLNIKIYI